MKSIVFLILSGCCVSILMAQHSTLRFTNSPINLNQQSILLVPFQSKMFLSEINKELALENQLNSSQIIERFTAAVDQSILYTFQERCNVSSFYLLEDEESKEDLIYVFDNLKLEYELVSKTIEKSRTEKIKAKLKKKEDDTYNRGSIQDGQIVTKRDDRERYMKAVVENNKMLDSMHFKFNNKFFLFVNQLDIRNVYTNAITMQSKGYDREIKLHYTLYNRSGEILTTGISRTTFPSNLNDINIIIQKHFPILAQNIYNSLFPDEGKKENNKLKLSPWK